jgi:ribosomal protein L7/L12|tara:strand:+ start:127 stop:570 length:444 start_codon:yes stop_codon:yes gene_type:complete
MTNISQDLLVEKLEMLIKLCEETEPTPKQLLKMSGEKNADMTDLFTPELIDAKFYLQEVLEGSYEIHDTTDIMKGANTIWRWRMKVKKDGWPDMSNIEYRCGELLKKNHKINAIKEYRAFMKDRDKEVSLREAKDWVDRLQVKMDLD